METRNVSPYGCQTGIISASDCSLPAFTFKGRDTLLPLRNTLRYVKEVASADTPERRAAHQMAAERIGTLITKIERHINCA